MEKGSLFVRVGLEQVLNMAENLLMLYDTKQIDKLFDSVHGCVHQR